MLPCLPGLKTHSEFKLNFTYLTRFLFGFLGVNTASEEEKSSQEEAVELMIYQKYRTI